RKRQKETRQRRSKTESQKSSERRFAGATPRQPRSNQKLTNGTREVQRKTRFYQDEGTEGKNGEIDWRVAFCRTETCCIASPLRFPFGSGWPVGKLGCTKRPIGKSVG